MNNFDFSLNVRASDFINTLTPPLPLEIPYKLFTDGGRKGMMKLTNSFCSKLSPSPVVRELVSKRTLVHPFTVFQFLLGFLSDINKNFLAIQKGKKLIIDLRDLLSRNRIRLRFISNGLAQLPESEDVLQILPPVLCLD